MATRFPELGTELDRDLRKSYNEGIVKIDEAINQTLADSSEAKTKADEALNKSDQTQKELDQAILEGDSSPLAGQLSVGSDGTIHTSAQQRLIAENQKLTSELAQTTHTRKVPLSQMGLSTLETEGTNNFTKLCEAIEKDVTLIVDGLYPITVSQPYSLTKDIRWIGLNKTCGFNFNVTSEYVFHIDSDLDINIDNMQIIGTSNVLFYNKALAHYLENIKISNNTFSGAVVLFILDIVSGDFDTRHGLGVMHFTDNTIDNLTVLFNGAKLSDGSVVQGIANLSNLPFSKIEVARNKIHNFVNSVICTAITNSYQSPSLLADNRKLLEVYDNEVINDATFHSQYANALYHTFILAECDTIKYYDNHVEGLTGLNQSVYDGYFSCRKLYYKNNVWINNLQLATTNTWQTNCLIKAKGNGYLASGEYAYREIKGNRFVIEETFVTALGYEAKWAVASLYDLIEDNINVEIYQNEIDIPVLRLQGLQQSAKKIVYEKNTIKAKGISGTFINNKLSDAEFHFLGNSILTTELLSSLSGYLFNSNDSFPQLKLMDSTDATIYYKIIKTSNNLIRGDIANSFMKCDYVDDFEMINDSIIDLKDSGTNTGTFFLINRFRKSYKVKNMYIKGCDSFHTFITRECEGSVAYTVKAPSYFRGVVIDTYNYKNSIATKDCMVTIDVTVFSEFTTYTGTFKFKLTNGKVIYKNSSGTLVEHIIDGSGVTGRRVYLESGDLPTELVLTDGAIGQLFFNTTQTVPNATVELKMDMKLI